MLVALEAKVARIFASQGLRNPGLRVISGFRTAAQQARVNPSVTNSFHTRCPALAVDLRLGNIPASVVTPELWAVVGNAWKSLGGRWGGDFSSPDLNHFDLPAPTVALTRETVPQRGVMPVPVAVIPRRPSPIVMRAPILF